MSQKNSEINGLALLLLVLFFVSFLACILTWNVHTILFLIFFIILILSLFGFLITMLQFDSKDKYIQQIRRKELEKGITDDFEELLQKLESKSAKNE